jgi:hypothetical protein
MARTAMALVAADMNMEFNTIFHNIFSITMMLTLKDLKITYLRKPFGMSDG